MSAPHLETYACPRCKHPGHGAAYIVVNGDRTDHLGVSCVGCPECCAAALPGKGAVK